MKKKINQILDSQNNIKIYFLPSLLILSFLLRIVTVYFIRDTHFDNEWNNLLDNLIDYKTFSFYNFNGTLIPSAYLPPVYPFFVYIIKIVGSFDKISLLYAVIFVQIILSTISVYLFYKLNENFFSNKISLINTIVFSIVPLNIIVCGQVSSASLQIFLSLLFLNFLFLVTKYQTNKNILLFSVISALLILTRGEFIIIFLLMISFVYLSKKIELLNLVKILVLVSILISPYLVRNYIHFNEIFIVKSVGYNLWKGNNQISKVEGHPEIMTESPKNYEIIPRREFKNLYFKLNNLEKNRNYEIERDKIFLDEAVANLNNNPIRYFKLYIKKFFSYFFIDFNSRYPNYYNLLHIFPIILLSILSLPGLFIFGKEKKFENRSLILYLFINLAIFSAFFILPRYKLAILPIQIILAAYFIIYKLKKNKV